jgi:hypothetical protein
MRPVCVCVCVCQCERTSAQLCLQLLERTSARMLRERISWKQTHTVVWGPKLAICVAVGNQTEKPPQLLRPRRTPLPLCRNPVVRA